MKKLTPERMKELAEGKRKTVEVCTKELNELVASEAALAEDLRKAKKAKDALVAKKDSHDREVSSQRGYILTKIASTRPSSAQSHISSMVCIRDDGAYYTDAVRKINKRVAAKDDAYRSVHIKIEELKSIITRCSKLADELDQKAKKALETSG